MRLSNKLPASLVVLLFLLASCGGSKKTSQTQKAPDSPVLVSIDDEKITKDTYQRVYEKSNKDKPNLYTHQSLKNYLDLYINFRLKVKEAKDMQLDTLPSIQQELKKYRNQLASSYLTDKQVLKELVKEAKKRMKEEVRARHILVKLPRNPTPQDTLQAYKEIKKIKQKLENGADFAQMAKKHSDDPSAKKNGGDIGYFKPLQVVYPFETAAYNTAEGKITGPVRTKFGYHLIKVLDKRPAQGKILTAHILIKKPKKASANEIKKREQQAHNIYRKIQEGASFTKMVNQYSDDKKTVQRDGKFRWFGAGETLLEYDTTAFSLQKNGAVAPPVETPRGWYIIKRLDKKSPPSFNEKRKEKLKQKIKNSKRAEIAKTSLVKEIKKENNFTPHPDHKKAVRKKISQHLGRRNKIQAKKYKDMDAPLFTLGEKSFTQYDLIKYIAQHPRKNRGANAKGVFNAYYKDFVKHSSLKYEKQHLKEKYPEFRALLNEYFNGILLFEITDRKVWSKAVEDTAGLKKYYEKHKQDYTWDRRLKATIYKCDNKKVAQTVRKVLSQRDIKTKEELYDQLNKQVTNNLTIENGKYEKGQNPYISQIDWKKGIHPTTQSNDGTQVIIQVHDILDPRIKKLDEIRGQVIADYQEHLENKWIRNLKKKYTVNIDKEVLRSLVKK